MIERLEQIVAVVRAEFAADPRTAVFEVELMEDGDALVVVGATSEPAAAEALQRRIGLLDLGRPVRALLARLPDASTDRAHAICASAVAPMLAAPLVSDPHVTQAVLGHRLLVLREHGRWLQCRSEDGYLGWIHRGYLKRTSESEARAWELGEGGESCFSLGARALDDAGAVLVRLPWGARVVRVGGGKFRLPSGELLRVEGELVAETERSARFPPVGARLVETARQWMGAPYVWGGLTRAGVDCSGLVQVVYRTHGVRLPRDSDQQAEIGTPLDAGRDFARLGAGDLLYFAEESGGISHVAMSMGGARIIHAAIGNGGVGCNDLLGSSRMEQELRRLFVCARRVLTAL